MAQILPNNGSSLTKCMNAIREGHLVAFPTETVYGLGANALNSNALEKIFEAKQRPKSDPLIVHVSKIEEALPLTDMTPFQKLCFTALGKKFWPGPLTLIVKCSAQVPSLVTSNTGYVGIRIPNHPLALHLLREVGLPIAAPSANTFGHVSPTSAEHVFHDLGRVENLFILDTDTPCQVGIESTILKIVDENEVSLLRPGSISSLDIQEELNKQNLNVIVKNKKRIIHENNMNEIEASGQLLTHYSPALESFILSDNIKNANLENRVKEDFLEQSILIDFNARHISLYKKVLKVFDLSSKGDFHEASTCLFSTLRQAEAFSEAKYILLPDFSNETSELAAAVFDRIYRAASGKYIGID